MRQNIFPEVVVVVGSILLFNSLEFHLKKKEKDKPETKVSNQKSRGIKLET